MTLRSDAQRGGTTHQRDADAVAVPLVLEDGRASNTTVSASDRAAERRERLATASTYAREVLDRHQFEDGRCSDGCGPWPCNSVVEAVQACDGDQ
ncbi:hypothetical protein BX266_0826 [Streptomyces sp. TLI_171]|nr:hypothetical protein BX266_0826 [Streptomyces sp. TLI_171]